MIWDIKKEQKLFIYSQEQHLKLRLKDKHRKCVEKFFEFLVFPIIGISRGAMTHTF
jgi:hypothetical protein